LDGGRWVGADVVGGWDGGWWIGQGGINTLTGSGVR
jgi:hypothetical protein